MSSTAQTVLAYLEAQTSDAYKLWDAGELAQANDLARGILVNPLATSYHKAQMHILLSLSSDSDSAIFHGEKAVDFYEHICDDWDPPATAEEEAWRQTILGTARESLQLARVKKAEKDAA